MLGDTQLGEVFVEHFDSLAIDRTHDGRLRHWPWFSLYVVVPAGSALVLGAVGFAPDAAGLLAGVGVLAGLLFQVLSTVSSRIAAIADAADEAASPRTRETLERLSMARANIAYASLVSVVLAVGLGVATLVADAPEWMGLPCAFLLVHLGLTLVLVLLRINRIGKSDRITALMAHTSR